MSEKNLVYEYLTTIRELHLDSFGHVNNAVYAELYEEARWDFITKNNFGLDRIKELQIGPVILDMRIRFKRELLNRENISIKSRTSALISSRIMVLEQIMYKADGKVASEAEFTIGLFDMKERKLVDASPEWLKAIGVR
jgi:acyl-CoA thioester hydrolase